MKLPPKVSLTELDDWYLGYLHGRHQRLSGIARGAQMAGRHGHARAFAEAAREVFQELATQVENQRERVAA